MNPLFAALGRSYRFVLRLISHPVVVAVLLLSVLLALPLCLQIGIDEPLYVIMALTAGWLVAFHTNYWIQKESLVRQLKWSVAKSLIENGSDTSSELVALDSRLRDLILRFDLRRGPVGEHVSEWGDIKTVIESKFKRYQQLNLEFIRLYEENEILFPQFRKRVNVFCERWSQVSSAYYKCHATLDVLMHVHTSIPAEDQHTEKIRQEIEELSSKCMELIGLYYDLRVDLLNATLGKLTHTRVANRAPTDPSVQSLSQLAENLDRFHT